MRTTRIVAGTMLGAFVLFASGAFAVANEPGGGDAGGGGSGGGDSFYYGSGLESVVNACRSLADRLNDGVLDFQSRNVDLDALWERRMDRI